MAATSNFFKFPRTKHILTAGSGVVERDDLLMTSSEANEFFTRNQTVVIEEKVDGANLGFSIDSNNKILIQNRSHFVNSKTHKQFNVLDTWIEKHSSSLFEILRPNRDILFGEWVYAKHSIHYTTLPDYFLAFDFYDKEERRFFSIKERNETLQKTEIACVRTIAEVTNFNKDLLQEYLDSNSAYYSGLIEGIVVRLENGNKESLKSHVYENRGKVVQPGFVQQIEEQWTKQKFTKNILLNY